ncbi:Permease of the drug/metabolite transporter (DMT) superfamily [Noviherbaspirillum humi]|uniref:Permease of the drug/metabolite transporter (DMT) superfamily n=1 Tax=Noviherbaspirillum humi TaxID=1688639 RepID=A0A239D6U0_9BURK|nr:DMT family transporter [Noviherbaspirillum humi]SNS27989.1 Permease of the drug/metabolite transporter (DMT) superfamily [Noviherbaspirillum humi]
MNKGISFALLAAVLFGASTPLAKILGAEAAPVLLAGLLYAGSGIGLGIWLLARRARPDRAAETAGVLTAGDYPWLAGAVLSGGMLGPVMLMTGLAQVQGSTASLLLNLEGVLTALLAWFVFREQFDRRIFIGMVLIIAAGLVLAGQSGWNQVNGFGMPWGELCIAAACLCWAIDNNLTRKVANGDALQIAMIKGLAAGAVNLGIALGWLNHPLPALPQATAAGLVGFAGYGLSLVLFVLALRHLGTARTGAYFSLAPFVGASLSLLLLGDQPGPLFWLAALLMAAGIWLHLTERHSHTHRHEPLAHSHSHAHDEHHQHPHDGAWDGSEPHIHFHRHAPLVHKHPHFPDAHHRHHH